MRSFKEIGKNVEIFEPISLINTEKIELKNHIRLSEFTVISGGEGVYIGNFVHVANHVSIVGGGVCIIEDFVGICAGVRIITGSDCVKGEGIPSPLVPEKYRSYNRSYVVCKKHSFIGTNSIIHPGVIIGEGTVVASGSLVTHNLESWSVYMGSPARKVKNRNPNIIQSMEEEIYEKNGIKPSKFHLIKP